MSVSEIAEDSSSKLHKLSDKWVLWAHLPHDTNWSVDSYIKILSFDTVEELVTLYGHFQENVVKNCMLFMMRQHINPVWEDKNNKNGGSFSFKINNKNIGNAWKNVCYAIAGNTISKDEDLLTHISGVTVSPKKSFCILKIWMNNCKFQNPYKIEKIDGLNFQGCIFKKHYNN